jgi:hypothetical protein
MFGDTKVLNAEVNLSKNYDHMIQWPKAGISIRGGTRYFYPPNMVFTYATSLTTVSDAGQEETVGVPG